MKSCAVVLIILATACAQTGPEVQIKNGRLEGKYMTTRNGRKFSAFLAIPYAKPPINELRFKDPVPVEPWPGVRKAVEDSPVCPQRNPYTRSSVIEGEEDCLFLNVYTPQLPSYGSDPLPVMIFFHGGGWICGAGNSMWYGPDILLDQDVVLVVPNYRLGPLGFLSTQDDVVPGNMGMKDQVMVLEWIRDNIASFGGNPRLVTGFGESAGGASVHLHMLSPLSKGLMHRGISQSGTALCPWALAPEDEPRRNAEKLARAFDCPVESSENMVDCLRKVDALDIIAKDHIFWDWDYDPMIPFKPMVEHNHPTAFLTEHPRKMIREGRTVPIPWMTGVTSNEGALRAAGIFGNPHLIDELEQDFSRIAPIALFYTSARDVDDVTRSIREFYFKGNRIGNDSHQQVVDLFTDGWFLGAADEAVRLHLKYVRSSVYYYYFDHRGAASFSAVFGDPHKDYGVCHADDLQYLFPVADGLFPDKPPTESDKRVAEIVTNMWVNFARTGNPTYDNNEIDPIVWRPVSENMDYLNIRTDDDITMQENLLSERTNFWNSLPIREESDHRRDEL